MGVRHALFPVLALGASFLGAASFPTLWATTSGVFGLVAGPLSIPFCGTTELLSEAFSARLGLVVALLDCEPVKETTSMISLAHPLNRVRGVLRRIEARHEDQTKSPRPIWRSSRDQM